MYCDHCGTRLQGAPAFCPSCGRALGRAPLMPSRIAGHIRLLGILWIALSAFRLLPGIFLLSFFDRHWSFLPPEVPFFVHGFLHTVGALFLVSGVVGIIAGWGLLERQAWARVLAIVLGFLNLIEMPFGTALGVYTLWVLLPAQSEAEYRQMSRAA
jgi:hypothetical protein